MKKALSNLYIALIMIFLYAPMLVMIILSFNESASTSVMTGFSLKWYGELFNDTSTLTALRNTLVLAIVSSIISTIIGTAAAVGISNMKKKWVQSSVLTVTNIPMMSPEIVTGVSLMLLFVFVGKLVGMSDVLGFPTLLIAHVTFNLPYVILSVLPKLRQTDKHLSEAAQDLGCTPVQAFFKVVLPNISSGIITGFIMAFTLSLDDFIISYFVSGPKFQTLPIVIFSMTKKKVKPDMYALSTLIFVAVLVLLVIMNVTQSKSEKKKDEKKSEAKKAERKRKFKKAVCVVLVISILAGVFSVSKSLITTERLDTDALVGNYDVPELKGTEINVYNWGEYISDGSEGTLDVIKEFEKLTGIKVNYAMFDSNEDLYSKLKSGGVSYDVLVPSDYMIARMISEDMLQPINFDNVPNISYISDKYKNAYFDPDGKYTVAYTGGMVGLIYNTTMVDEAPTSWSVMWDEKYSGQILTFNNSRDAFGVAQYLLGYSINSTDKSQWDEAAQKLIEQKPLIQSYVMDEVFDKMEMGEAAIAPYYAGDYLTMADINPDLAFVYPDEGTNIFIDAMCIPANAKNKEAAELFINFMCEPEIALANANYLGYLCPNTAVLSDDRYEYKDNEVLYPEKEVKTEYFHNLDQDMLDYLASLWEKVKLA